LRDFFVFWVDFAICFQRKIPANGMKFIAIDTETTGFHRPLPVEIAA
jgi:DNA polymerase III epsilon subunit-like protein